MLDKIAIGERIEKLRKEKTGLSQLLFAERIGICRGTYTNILKGHGLFNHLEEIAAALGVSEMYILLGYEPLNEELSLKLEQDHQAKLKQQRDYYEGKLELAMKDAEKYRALYEDQKKANQVLSQLSSRTLAQESSPESGQNA